MDAAAADDDNVSSLQLSTVKWGRGVSGTNATLGVVRELDSAPGR